MRDCLLNVATTNKHTFLNIDEFKRLCETIDDKNALTRNILRTFIPWPRVGATVKVEFSVTIN